MSVRSLFQSRLPRSSSSAGAASVGVIGPEDTARRLEVLEDIEQAGIGWIWASDAEGRLIYLTDGALAKLGKAREELLGQALVDIFETDPDNPDGGTQRPLNFQLTAHNKLTDLTLRFALGKSRHDVKQIWW